MTRSLSSTSVNSWLTSGEGAILPGPLQTLCVPCPLTCRSQCSTLLQIGASERVSSAHNCSLGYFYDSERGQKMEI